MQENKNIVFYTLALVDAGGEWIGVPRCLPRQLSSQCEVFVAPAMDLDMYAHPANQKNLATLSANGVLVLPTEEGFLASGLEGKGRMQEPEDMVSFMENHISKHLPLFGKKVVLTAGPTYESIDPVRFIGNNSSGKMGFELAKQAAALGAELTTTTQRSKFH